MRYIFSFFTYFFSIYVVVSGNQTEIHLLPQNIFQNTNSSNPTQITFETVRYYPAEWQDEFSSGSVYIVPSLINPPYNYQNTGQPDITVGKIDSPISLPRLYKGWIAFNFDNLFFNMPEYSIESVILHLHISDADASDTKLYIKDLLQTETLGGFETPLCQVLRPTEIAPKTLFNGIGNAYLIGVTDDTVANNDSDIEIELPISLIKHNWSRGHIAIGFEVSGIDATEGKEDFFKISGDKSDNYPWLEVNYTVPVSPGFEMNIDLLNSQINKSDIFNFNIQFKNLTSMKDHGGLTVHFPLLTELDPDINTEFIDYNSTQAQVWVNESTNISTAFYRFYQFGQEINRKDGSKTTPDYLMFEMDVAQWSPDEEVTLGLSIKPNITGSFPILIRGWICQGGETGYGPPVWREPSGDESSIQIDQQGYWVYAYNLQVKQDAESESNELLAKNTGVSNRLVINNKDLLRIVSQRSASISNKIFIDNTDLISIISQRNTGISNTLSIDNLGVFNKKLWFYGIGRDSDISERFLINNLKENSIYEWDFHK